MLFKFSRHTLEQTEDGYILTLYMELENEEYSNEFENIQNSSNNLLNKSIMIYIKKNLSTIKINTIKVMAGAVLIFTISMTALEKSLQASYTYSSEHISSSSISIILNNKLLEFSQPPFVLDGIIYAPIREISEALGAKVSWNSESKYAIIYNNNVKLSFEVGQNECILNDEHIKMPQSIIVNGKTMVPIRFLSEIFNFKVEWDDKFKVAILSSTGEMLTNKELEQLILSNTKVKSEINYTNEDLYWLSRLVHAEAQSEPYEGKLAVANVILNRVKSNEFPNSIKGVIFDRTHSVQFTPTVNGEIYKTPSSESEKAALEALQGNNNAKNILYFLNPKKSPVNWITKNRNYAFTISNHNFYF